MFGMSKQHTYQSNKIAHQNVQRLFFGRKLQHKLTINQPNDIYEQEADAMADRVMRMTDHEYMGLPFFRPRVSSLQRKCARCEEEENNLQRKKVNNEEIPQNNGFDSYVSQLNSGGKPLSKDARNFYEPRFAYDFSHVKIHTDNVAAKSAQSINALAYTSGNHIVFNNNQYSPGTVSGKRLLGHELTHVVQQTVMPKQKNIVQMQSSVAVPAPAPATIYHPGVNHGHTPSGRWSDVQANPNSGFLISQVCSRFSPNTVVGIAISREFSDKPIALEHLNWYLSTGAGADFVEDGYLDRMLRTDAGIQTFLSGRIPTSAPVGGRFRGHVKVEQFHYRDQDFRYAFGAIDRLDFEADFTAGTLHAWFQDRYEWHPVYPGLYTAFPDDVARETNCVHAALVELKAGGVAKDYWMKGEATVPLSLFNSAVAPSTGNDL